MSSQTIKLVEMIYYKKKKIELKLTNLHKIPKSASTVAAILDAILNK